MSSAVFFLRHSEIWRISSGLVRTLTQSRVPLPPSMRLMTSLKNVDLSGNDIKEDVASIFENLGRLPALIALKLARNRIGGVIPQSGRLAGDSAVVSAGEFVEDIDIFPSLISLTLARNSIHGPLTDGLAERRYISSIDLSFNQLEGSIPDSYGDLTTLNLEGNPLAAPISHSQELPPLPKQTLKCACLLIVIAT